MSIFRRNSAKIARAEVAQWFALTPSGTVFLSSDGRAFPLGADEAMAVRASAETKAVQWHVTLETRGWIAVAIVLFVVIGSQALADGLDAPWNQAVRAAAYGLYAAHGAWMLYEAWKVMKAMRALRGGIALSLQGRVPLDSSRAGALALINPIPAIIVGIMLLVLVWNWLAELVSHRGIDLIGWIPGWLPISFAVFVCVAVLGNRWIDRSRGVGVLPSEDLASRVLDRLDRERIGR